MNVADEEEWCAIHRARVVDYLECQQVKHGAVGEWPAGHLHPFISVWAVESAKEKGWVIWSAVSGDLPCDDPSADRVKHPKKALRVLGNRWLPESNRMAEGSFEEAEIGPPDKRCELTPLLKIRAESVIGVVGDPALWNQFERNRQKQD